MVSVVLAWVIVQTGATHSPWGDPMPEPESPRRSTPQQKGQGVLCPEAQADGVPCEELGRDCETCEKAAPAPDQPVPSPPQR